MDLECELVSYLFFVFFFYRNLFMLLVNSSFQSIE
jgi:hypothetical protein